MWGIHKEFQRAVPYKDKQCKLKSTVLTCRSHSENARFGRHCVLFRYGSLDVKTKGGTRNSVTEKVLAGYILAVQWPSTLRHVTTTSSTMERMQR